MNESIIHFLQQQTCATVCCVNETFKPWCFNCFYVFNPELGVIYYKSSQGTQHSAILKSNPEVAGTILPDKLNKLLVKGVQFEGILLEPGHPLAAHGAAQYYKKNPLALAMPGEIWTIQLNHIKMTDSTKGFGKKITWDRAEFPAVISS
jgi:uncharacterized protein